MTDTPYTLSMLAGLDADAEGAMLTSAERRAATRSIADAVVNAGHAVGTGAIARLILERLTDKLRAPLAEVLTEGWKQDQQLRSVAERSSAKRTAVAEVELAEHKVTVSISPRVEIMLSGRKVATVKFRVATKLQLKGILLVIRDATVTGIKAGSIKGTLEVFYVQDSGGKEQLYPVMPARTRTIATERVMVLPAGGIRIV